VRRDLRCDCCQGGTNDDCTLTQGSTLTSCLLLTLPANTRHYVQVGGYRGAKGALRVVVVGVPTSGNDNYARYVGNVASPPSPFCYERTARCPLGRSMRSHTTEQPAPGVVTSTLSVVMA